MGITSNAQNPKDGLQARFALSSGRPRLRTVFRNRVMQATHRPKRSRRDEEQEVCHFAETGIFESGYKYSKIVLLY